MIDCTPAVQRLNAHHYQAPHTITEMKVFDGFAHLLPAQPGWEAVADYALDRAVRHASVVGHGGTPADAPSVPLVAGREGVRAYPGGSAWRGTPASVGHLRTTRTSRCTMSKLTSGLTARLPPGVQGSAAAAAPVLARS